MLMIEADERRSAVRHFHLPRRYSMQRHALRIGSILVIVAAAVSLAGCGANNVWQAAGTGQKHEVERFLNDNPNWVNAKDSAGRTPLMDAVRGEHEQVVKLLLERGADPRITGASGVNALHEARAANNSNITRMIEKKIEELEAKERGKAPGSP
jgi:hypothetical protein